MDIKRVGLIVKENDQEAKNLSEKIIRYILDAKPWGINIPIQNAIDVPHFTKVNAIPSSNMYAESDAFIVLGGDGTMLQAASYTGIMLERVVPVLGINLGRVGYLSTIPPEDALSEIDRLEGDRNTFITRKMLRIRHSDRWDKHYPALNEVVLHWSHKARLINLYLGIEGDGEFEIRADGIIISTPTGSTAYNYAAGGPIVHPDINSTLITPVCPFSGLRGTLELPMQTTITVKSDERNVDVGVTIDGHTDFPLDYPHYLLIDKFPTPFVLVNPHTSSYMDVLKTKLSIIGQK